jgi:hypothetical protein
MELLIHLQDMFIPPHLRRRVLIIVLLFRLISQILQPVLILLKPRFFLQSSLIRHIHTLALSRHRCSLLNSRSVIDSLPPTLQVRELGKIHTSEVCDINPTEVSDICDRIFAFTWPDQVVSAFQLVVEDTVETLGFADISLGGVGDSLLRETVEMVRLSLHGSLRNH